MQEHTVWQYWHDELVRPSDYLLACVASVGRHYGRHRLVTRRSLEDFMPRHLARPVLDGWFEHPGHESNYVRAWLLYQYGGVWMDVDYLAFRKMKFPSKYGLYTYKVGEFPQNSFLCSESKSEGATAYWNDVRDGVLKTDGKLSWEQSGSETLLRVIDNSKDVGFLDEKSICPYHWNQMGNLLFPTVLQPAQISKRSQVPGVMFFAQSMPEGIKAMGFCDLWRSKTHLGLFFRTAFDGLGCTEDTFNIRLTEFLPFEFAHLVKSLVGKM